MATLEKPTLRMQPHDEAIFVAGDGRRARRLGRAALVASVLAGLWIVGLGIGMLGFGSLPGVSLVKGSRVESPVAPVEGAPAAAARETARALLSVKTAAAAIEVSRTSNRQRRSQDPRAEERGREEEDLSRRRDPAGSASAGRSREPGSANSRLGAERQSGPSGPGPQGDGRRRRRRATAGASARRPPAAPPPAPPGQVRKALDPPPPPPKKG